MTDPIKQHTCWNCSAKVPRLPEDIARGQANTDAVVRGEAMPRPYQVGQIESEWLDAICASCGDTRRGHMQQRCGGECVNFASIAQPESPDARRKDLCTCGHRREGHVIGGYCLACPNCAGFTNVALEPGEYEVATVDLAALADQLPNLNWRHFGVGALQAYLSEGESVERRVHIWHPSLVREGIDGYGDCHDHRFSFVSQVLCGEIWNRTWKMRESENGYFDVYSVENARKAHARTGNHDGTCHIIGRAEAWLDTTERIRAGRSYTFPRGKFHQSKCDRLAVTLVTKFDQVDVPARILCPHGSALVHAFGGPEPDIKGIVADAVAALRAGITAVRRVQEQAPQAEAAPYMNHAAAHPTTLGNVWVGETRPSPDALAQAWGAEPIAPATPRSESASHAHWVQVADTRLGQIRGLNRQIESTRNELHRASMERDEALAKVAAFEVHFVEEEKDLLATKAKVAELTERCLDLSVTATQALDQESGLRSKVVELTAANDVAGAELHRLIAELADRTTELEAARAEQPAGSVYNFAKAILHGDADHRRWLLNAVTEFLCGDTVSRPPPPAESPEPAPGVDAPEVKP